MAKGSQKRIAGQNEKAVKNLRLGMIVPTILSIVLRLIFRRSSLPPSKGALAIYILTYLPALFLSRYLENIGTSRRDPTTGTLISSGEDLNQSGVTEWCFDILYVTWGCQIGSGAFGEWVWYLYLVIPLYAFLKLWTSFISPMVLGRSSAPPSEETTEKETLSKRQEKLRKRGERGDPRVRASRK
ncbi:hypothetical protein SERLA73DRAFT_177080 [Serpula lacrymans var. lacrymans S7.3]|uniref:DUF788-domain-containing protein n=2 Tax=Serpula lacrymans var. lacrymans TaxID=341189 RepID=F8PR04_SERL3|nr:uncharacterized protein SERLADRAFT_460507 [Serpula lacrymans var. lacrymans S7.9]EGO01661.1 hypothetical protein SERLA73DRAFT_177080 [Serpula lacrymans var. lacrymans S7.3]EGO27307.1 hypothetical protein SERLADRAFT_460507 [Serpula lacrymans var. lacrymans S7.9]